jgi:hypothetical protein
MAFTGNVYDRFELYMIHGVRYQYGQWRLLGAYGVAQAFLALLLKNLSRSASLWKAGLELTLLSAHNFITDD